MGGLVAAGFGLGGLGAQQGWWQAPLFSNLGKVPSITMLVAGSVVGISLVAAAIFGFTKSRSKSAIEIYGREAWQSIGIELEGEIPAPLSIDWNKKDPFFKKPISERYALVYIPEPSALKFPEDPPPEHTKVLESFKKLVDDKEIFYSCQPGWQLISKGCIPGSKGKKLDTVSRELEQNGCHLPHSFEAAAAFAFFRYPKGRRIFANHISKSTPFLGTHTIEGDLGSSVIGDDDGSFSYQKWEDTEGSLATKESYANFIGAIAVKD